MAFIGEALRDLKSLDKPVIFFSPWKEYAEQLHCSIFYELVPKLRILRTFVLCARKLGNDTHLRTDEGNNNSQESSLGSLLARIEEAVSRHAQEIHPYCRSLETGLADHVLHLIGGFQDDIISFEEEIGEWYIILTNCLQQTISPSTAADEVIAITASVLENLVDVLRKFQYFSVKVLVVESLIVKIEFLGNFIFFAMLRSVDHRELEDMLNHIAVKAAHLSFKCLFNNVIEFHVEWLEEMWFQISVLVQEIKPIDHHTYATYTQALTSSKLQRQLHAPMLDRDYDPIMIM